MSFCPAHFRRNGTMLKKYKQIHHDRMFFRSFPSNNKHNNLSTKSMWGKPDYSVIYRTYGKIVYGPVHSVLVINRSDKRIFIGFLHFNNTSHLACLGDFHIHLISFSHFEKSLLTLESRRFARQCREFVCYRPCLSIQLISLLNTPII